MEKKQRGERGPDKEPRQSRKTHFFRSVTPKSENIKKSFVVTKIIVEKYTVMANTAEEARESIQPKFGGMVAHGLPDCRFVKSVTSKPKST